jgi:MEMO1 family protein
VPSARPAAVAGTFYPGEPQALAAEVAAYLAQAPACHEARPPKAIIAPHAGYMYSGAIAGTAYAQLGTLAGRIERVILIGPAHRMWVAGMAVPSVMRFDSPLGAVALDTVTLARLATMPGIEVSDPAHALEHSLEVQLPFLQAALGMFLLVPVVVGGASPRDVERLLDAVWGGEETLIVVSSDLSHYLAYDAARSRDHATVQAILALDARLDHDEACGATAINGLLSIARRRGLAARALDIRSSGDTAGGRDRVVGYGAFAFHEVGDGNA